MTFLRLFRRKAGLIQQCLYILGLVVQSHSDETT